MWTNTKNFSIDGLNWQPNNFVPLIQFKHYDRNGLFMMLLIESIIIHCMFIQNRIQNDMSGNARLNYYDVKSKRIN